MQYSIEWFDTLRPPSPPHALLYPPSLLSFSPCRPRLLILSLFSSPTPIPRRGAADGLLRDIHPPPKHTSNTESTHTYIYSCHRCLSHRFISSFDSPFIPSLAPSSSSLIDPSSHELNAPHHPPSVICGKMILLTKNKQPYRCRRYWRDPAV